MYGCSRAIGAWVATWVLVLALAGDPATAQSAFLGTVRGVVRDPGGRPVPLATVRVTLGATSGATIAGTDGRFELGQLAPGRYLLTAEKEEYLSRSLDNVIVTAGSVTRVTFVLPRVGRSTGDLFGTVRTPAGDPLPDTEVVLSAAGTTLRVGTTGRDGEYVFAGLPPGLYDLSFRRDGFFPLARRAIGVVAARVTRLHVRLTADPAQAGALVGRVVDSDRAPLLGARVTVVAGFDVGASVTTDADGRFALRGLTPGDEYGLQVEKTGFISYTAEHLRVDAREETELLVVLRRPVELSGAIAGTVRDSLARPIGGARVRLTAGSIFGREAVTDPEGTYRIAGLPPGNSYALTAIAAGFRAGQASGVTVLPGAETTVDFALAVDATPPGEIAGQIIDPDRRPIVGALITVTAGPLTGGVATSDTLGRYRLSGLPPGTGYALRADAPGFVSGFASGLAVQSARVTTVHLRLARGDNVGGAIVGTIVDPSARPVAGANVTIVAGPVVGYQAFSDGDGQFQILGLPAGSYDLRIDAEGFVPHFVQNVVVTVQAAVVRVTLQPNVGIGTLAGVVRNREGQALPSAEVSLTAGPSAPQRTFTDSAGRFEFDSLQAGGGYRVRVEAMGYRVAEVSDLTVLPDRTTTVMITLQPLASRGTIAGVVRDLASRPVEGARVEVSAGPAFPPPVFTGTDGSFSLGGLLPGTYTIRVSAAGYRPAQVGPLSVTAGNTTRTQILLTR